MEMGGGVGSGEGTGSWNNEHSITYEGDLIKLGGSRVKNVFFSGRSRYAGIYDGHHAFVGAEPHNPKNIMVAYIPAGEVAANKKGQAYCKKGDVGSRSISYNRGESPLVFALLDGIIEGGI